MRAARILRAVDRAWLVGVIVQFAGCASTPGARPEENSVAGHEQAASQHEAEAAAAAENCKRGTPPAGTVCWTSVTNPNPHVQKEVAKHEKMAADHRAASQALRDAEAGACAGVSPKDRDESPFAHREDIEGVDMITSALGGRSGGFRLNGASVRFRALPGMTAEWLQRVVDCHMARNAAMGYAMPEMSYCPLMLRDVTATVTSTGRGFAIAVRSDSVETATEIKRRAEALLPAGPVSGEPGRSHDRGSASR
jgi:hypothetical protein